MTATTDGAKPVETQPQSAAAPSPFTPIEQYAFLSDCHTGALVAPDGAIDWLCVPRFDAPSVFGSLLDREAGSFRVGPFGITYPGARAYEPGTNVLVTTWHTRTGWLEVRDALTIGPRRGEDTVTPHTRPPTDDDGDHMLVRTVTCIDGSVEVELVCEPVFDYGRTAAEWTLVDEDRRIADASGAGVTIRLATDMALGVEGGRVRARHTLHEGERLFCALSWAEGLHTPADVAEAAAQLDTTTRYWRNWLTRARIPDHRFRSAIRRSALAIKGLTYMPTGATVAGAHHVAARDPGRRAQLGLPLHVDPRLDVHAAGAALARPRLGGRRVHAVRRRPRARRGRLAADHVRDRRAARPHRDHTRRPLGLRRGASGASRQRRLRPAPERRLRSGAGLDPAAHAPLAAPPAPPVAARPVTGRLRDEGLARADQGIWEARGEPQHYVSSKLMGWVAMDRAAKLAEIRGDNQRAATWRATADEIKADILEHGVDSRGVLRQHYATDALDASTLLAVLFGFLPDDDPRLKATVLAIADELTEHGFVLRYKTDETDDGLAARRERS
jgi:GH15 family glucan-1,4-alpha-glucosidase